MRHLTSPLTRLAAVATTTLLAVSVTAGPATAAPADRAAGWLSGELTDGLVVGEYQDTWTDPENPVWVEYNDYWLTADFGYALAEIGGHDETLAQLSGALAENVDSWTTNADWGAPEQVSAGSTAKALVLAQVAGSDPADFGGVDLVTRLEQRVNDAKPLRGRIEDSSTPDYANTIGQAFAARGLARAGSDEAKAAVKFLLKQQCGKGFFRLQFSATDAEGQSCSGAPKADRSPDTDVTALAVIHLKALPKSARTKATKRAIKDARAWLKQTQGRKGQYGGGPATESANANSTGLASWALGVAGACGKASKAAAWVKRLQVSRGAKDTELAGERGAIAYDRQGYRAGARKGIGRKQEDQWRRATSQAAPGLLYSNCR